MRMKPINLLPMLAISLSLSACSSSQNVQGRPFEVTSVVKNDIDLVSETHQQKVFASLKALAVKLYKRNPAEWKKSGHATLDETVAALTADPFPQFESKHGVDSIRLAFEEDYRGDRVGAYIAGLETMVLEAYDGHRSFYLHNMLEAQKLYDSARNIEVAAWMLRTRRNEKGELFLLSTGDKEQVNLSFERLFGKMINAQDMLAQITADRNHRQIKNVIQAVATAFIPL